MIEMAEMVEPSNKCQTPYPSVLDFWKIKFEKSSWRWYILTSLDFPVWNFENLSYFIHAAVGKSF